MPKQFTRRQFLRSGALFGTAASLGIPILARMQAEEATMSLELTGSFLRVHDPVIIKAPDAYYLYCTGNGISERKSADFLD